MKLVDVLEELATCGYAVKRQSWRNKKKALFIAQNGGLSVCYENRQGSVAVSRYVLYMADLKADDWVLISIPSRGEGLKVDSLQKQWRR